MSTFHLFPSLPLELRLQIIHRSFTPRTIPIHISISSRPSSTFSGWSSSLPPPIALSTNREFRTEALKFYRLSFGTSRFPARIYFNPENDTLAFCGNGEGAADYALNLWFGKTYDPFGLGSKVVGLGRVRRVLLDVDVGIFGRPLFCWDEVRRFEGLEFLKLVVWEEEEEMRERIMGFEDKLRLAREKYPDWKVPRMEVVDERGVQWGSLGTE